MNSETCMLKAIALAEKGVGFTNPNPLVGAVIVKDNRIIGQGYHEEYGKPHAERNALADCRDRNESPVGAMMYVTLEPCCHHGKTPPCVDAIIESGIGKVVVGCLDPNPKVAGKGIEALRNAGIEVITGVSEAECLKLNEVFFHYIKENTPYVVMKYAMTLDGKIATVSGESKWITGDKARENVHAARRRYMGIMVGIGTVLADNPMLNCRMNGGKNPIRIICDTNLRIPIDSDIVKTANEIRTVIAYSCESESKQSLLIESGCEILNVPLKENHIDLRTLMSELGNIGIDSVLLEGGGDLNFSALKSGIVNKVQAYIAPKIFGGGTNAKTPVGGYGFSQISECVKLKNPRIEYFGEDIMIESEVEHSCSQG